LDGLTVVGFAVGLGFPKILNPLISNLALFAVGGKEVSVAAAPAIGAEEKEIVGADVTGAKDGAFKGLDPFEVHVQSKVHSFC